MHSEYIETMIAKFEHEAELRNDVHVVATNWFVNRCPLVSRVPRLSIGSTTFTMRNRGKADYQFCQTFRHPVTTGRFRRPRITVEPTTPPWPRRQAEPETPKSPFDSAKMEALQNLMDDMETSCYYGTGEDPTTCGRPKQKGLRTLLTTNRTLTPENADAFRASDLIRDTLERCRDNGGDPDVLLLSSNFASGVAKWGYILQRLDAGTTIFGQPIDIYEAPFLGGMTVIEAPLLRPFTAVCLTSSEVRLRMKRNEFWNPRGDEGDWIAEGAIEVENESHHAWIEGITGFAA